MTDVPFVVWVESRFEGFAMAARQLSACWCVAWAGDCTSVEAWLEKREPLVIVFSMLQPTRAALARLLFLRSRTSATFVVSLSHHDELVRRLLENSVARCVVVESHSFASVYDELALAKSSALLRPLWGV